MDSVLNQAASWSTVGAFIVAVVSLVVIAFQARRYVSMRNADLRQREFENYHQILDLALGGGGGLYADRQAAAIFELRYYENYREFTLRAMSRLLEKCELSGEPKVPAVRTIIDEIGYTVAHLKKGKF